LSEGASRAACPGCAEKVQFSDAKIHVLDQCTPMVGGGIIPLPLAEHAPLGWHSPNCSVHHLLRLPRSVIVSDATRSASSAWDCWWMLPPRRIHHADPRLLLNTRRNGALRRWCY